MKKIMMKLLSELLKDSSRSDRKLGKILGVSQPTVSRTRNKLVKDEVIQQFTIIPTCQKWVTKSLRSLFSNFRKEVQN